MATRFAKTLTDELRADLARLRFRIKRKVFVEADVRAALGIGLGRSQYLLYSLRALGELHFDGTSRPALWSFEPMEPGKIAKELFERIERDWKFRVIRPSEVAEELDLPEGYVGSVLLSAAKKKRVRRRHVRFDGKDYKRHGELCYALIGSTADNAKGVGRADRKQKNAIRPDALRALRRYFSVADAREAYGGCATAVAKYRLLAFVERGVLFEKSYGTGGRGALYSFEPFPPDFDDRQLERLRAEYAKSTFDLEGAVDVLDDLPPRWTSAFLFNAANEGKLFRVFGSSSLRKDAYYAFDKEPLDAERARRRKRSFMSREDVFPFRRAAAATVEPTPRAEALRAALEKEREKKREAEERRERLLWRLASRLALEFWTDAFSLRDAEKVFKSKERAAEALRFAARRGAARADGDRWAFYLWFCQDYDRFFDVKRSRNEFAPCLYGKFKERYLRVKRARDKREPSARPSLGKMAGTRVSLAGLFQR